MREIKGTEESLVGTSLVKLFDKQLKPTFPLLIVSRTSRYLHNRQLYRFKFDLLCRDLKFHADKRMAQSFCVHFHSCTSQIVIRIVIPLLHFIALINYSSIGILDNQKIFSSFSKWILMIKLKRKIREKRFEWWMRNLRFWRIAWRIDLPSLSRSQAPDNSVR